MLKEEVARRELIALRSGLFVDLYQRAGSMAVNSVESLSRRIHVIDLKIYSFKGGQYDQEK